MQKCTNLVDVTKIVAMKFKSTLTLTYIENVANCFEILYVVHTVSTSILFFKIGFDTADNERGVASGKLETSYVCHILVR